MTKSKDTLVDWLFAWFAVALIGWLLTGGIADWDHITGAIYGSGLAILFYILLWRIMYRLFIKRREEAEWHKAKKRFRKQLKTKDQQTLEI